MGLERYMVDHRGSPRLALHVLVICKSKTAPHPVICPCKLVIQDVNDSKTTYNDICLKLYKREACVHTIHLKN